MKKYTITLVFSIACAPFFAQSVTNNDNPTIESGITSQGEKANYPEAKTVEVTPEIKGSSTTGGVMNKKEILAKKNKNSNQNITINPVVSAGTKPKNN